MIFHATAIDGAYVVEANRLLDQRGFFARVWCSREFADAGLNAELAQCSVSHSRRRHTLRGMHFQMAPHEETKLVCCLRGKVYDAVVDLRRTSATFCQWTATELSSSNSRMMYVPKGCAHGFLTLSSNAEVMYFISAPFDAESASGVRWNDPAFGIVWPAVPSVIAKRDREFADFVA